MVRKKETAKDKSPAVASAPVDEEIGTLTQTRARRAPKPNPKYINDNIISTPKALSTSSESPAVSDTEEAKNRTIKTTAKKMGTVKKETVSVKPSDPPATPSIESRTLRQRAGTNTGKESVQVKVKGKPGPKKQKLDFDDSDVGHDEIVPEDEFKNDQKKEAKNIRLLKTSKAATKPAATPVKRLTRATENKSEEVSAKTDAILDLDSLECKEVVQDSEDIETTLPSVGKSSFVTIVNVTDIIQNKPNLSPDVTTRKRTSEDTDSADSGNIKKKYKEEKPSLISERKSYLPKHNQSGDIDHKAKSPASALATKPKQISPVESPAKLIGRRRALQQTLIESKEKAKLQRERANLKQQPVQKKQSPVVKKQAILIAPTENSSGVKLFTPPSVHPVRTVNNGKFSSPNVNNRSTSNPTSKVMVGKALPQRILNSSLTPIAKQQEQVKLLNTENSFSIDLTADEENSLSPGKKLNKLQDLKGLQNSSNMINKTTTMMSRESTPQDPKDRLSKSLNASLSHFREQAKSQQKKPQSSPQSITIVKKLDSKPTGPIVQRKITRFESWFIIDVPKIEMVPQKHQHSFSLMHLGNNIKDIQLPPNWDYKIILQRRQPTSSFDETDVFTGDLQESHHQIKESEKHQYEPSNIMFKRTVKQNNRSVIDRSLFFKTDIYAITIDGKKSVLVGAPDNITSVDDIQALLEILHSVNFKHNCVEGLTNETYLL